MMGKLIVIEGSDGAGKSTLLLDLITELKLNDHKIKLYREPGGTIISEQIRNVVLNKANTNINAKTEVLLFAAARVQLMEEKIMNDLISGYNVILDRYIYSSIVYQGLSAGDNNISIDFIKMINPVKNPDILIILTVDPEVGLTRIGKRNVSNRIDNKTLKFHQLVNEGYEHLAENIIKDEVKNIFTLDTTKLEPKDVFLQCLYYVNKHI